MERKSVVTREQKILTAGYFVKTGTLRHQLEENGLGSSKLTKKSQLNVCIKQALRSFIGKIMSKFELLTTGRSPIARANLTLKSSKKFPSPLQTCRLTIFRKLRRAGNQTSMKRYGVLYDSWQTTLGWYTSRIAQINTFEHQEYAEIIESKTFREDKEWFSDGNYVFMYDGALCYGASLGYSSPMTLSVLLWYSP